MVLDVAEVRRLRRERGLREQAILDQLGLTPNDWRRVMDGRHELRLDELGHLAGLLGVDPGQVLTAVGEPKAERAEETEPEAEAAHTTPGAEAAREGEAEAEVARAEPKAAVAGDREREAEGAGEQAGETTS